MKIKLNFHLWESRSYDRNNLNFQNIEKKLFYFPLNIKYQLVEDTEEECLVTTAEIRGAHILQRHYSPFLSISVVLTGMGGKW